MREAPGAGASGAMWGLLFRCFRGSLVEGVGDGGDHAHALDVWRVGVAVFDGDLALRGVLYASESALAHVGKLLGCCAGVCYCFVHHFALDAIERSVVVADRVFVVAAHYGDAVFEQFALSREQRAHFINLARCNGDH